MATELKRSDRSTNLAFLIVAAGLTALFVTLLVLDKGPPENLEREEGRPSSFLLAALPVLVGGTCLLTYRVVFPSTFTLAVFEDRLLLNDSSSPTPIEYRREDVRQFLLKKIETDEGQLVRVIIEKVDLTTEPISDSFVSEKNEREFFDAIATEWTPQYVPYERQDPSAST